MKLSTRTRYGTRALLDLARYQGDKPVQLKEIAQRQNISLHYLEHIITPMVGAGIIRSIRGAKGGLQLSRKPEQIKLSEVVTLLEGTITPVDCVMDPECCGRSDFCVTRDIWTEMKEAIDKTLDSYTLKDLMEREISKEPSMGASI